MNENKHKHMPFVHRPLPDLHKIRLTDIAFERIAFHNQVMPHSLRNPQKGLIRGMIELSGRAITVNNEDVQIMIVLTDEEKVEFAAFVAKVERRIKVSGTRNITVLERN